MKIKYFAWVREHVGVAEEEVSLPQSVATVRDLLDWLKARGDGYGEALRYPEAIRVAIDQEHAQHSEMIAGASEIALFPPMTGG